MSDGTTTAAETPRKKADVWAHEKQTPPWQLAAARLVSSWPPSQLLREAEFDAAIAHARDLAFG